MVGQRRRTVLNCPNCRVPAAAEALECGACGVIFAKWAEKEVRAQAVTLLAAAAPVAAAPEEPTEELTRFQALTIPAICLGVAIVLAVVDVGRFLVQAGISMETHELGHAVVNWLGGRIAVPLPMITIIPSLERSYLFAVTVLAGIAWLAKTAWEENCRFVAALCAAAFLLQLRLTFARPDVLEFWVAFGGLGGECVIPALLIALYFQPLPRAARWPVYRVFFLLLGMCVLAASVRRWRDANADFMNVPWGSFWGGDGDVEAMISGGWTVNVLVKVYLRLAWTCAAAAAMAWARAIAKVTAR